MIRRDPEIVEIQIGPARHAETAHEPPTGRVGLDRDRDDAGRRDHAPAPCQARLGGLASIVSDETCASFSIVFGDYATYSVTREIFSPPSEEDIYEGKSIRIYSRSKFIEGSREFLHDFYGNLASQKHYQIVCEWHVIDVMSPNEPKIYLGREKKVEQAEVN